MAQENSVLIVSQERINKAVLTFQYARDYVFNFQWKFSSCPKNSAKNFLNLELLNI